MNVHEEKENNYRNPILLHVSKFTCTSESALQLVKSTLHLMSNFQLKKFPGVMTYMFSYPDKTNYPHTLEFIEIYQHEKVFWEHTNNKEIHKSYFKGFSKKNKKEVVMYSYGAINKRVEVACRNIESIFPTSFNGSYIINKKYTGLQNGKDSKKSCLLRIEIFPCSKDEEIHIVKVLREMIKDQTPITFHISENERKSTCYYDIIIIYEDNKKLVNHFENGKWEELFLMNTKHHAWVYGNVNEKSQNVVSKIFKNMKFLGNPEIGYILHPRCELVGPKEINEEVNLNEEIEKLKSILMEKDITMKHQRIEISKLQRKIKKRKKIKPKTLSNSKEGENDEEESDEEIGLNEKGIPIPPPLKGFTGGGLINGDDDDSDDDGENFVGNEKMEKEIWKLKDQILVLKRANNESTYRMVKMLRVTRNAGQSSRESQILGKEVTVIDQGEEEEKEENAMPKLISHVQLSNVFEELKKKIEKIKKRGGFKEQVIERIGKESKKPGQFKRDFTFDVRQFGKSKRKKKKEPLE